MTINDWKKKHVSETASARYEANKDKYKAKHSTNQSSNQKQSGGMNPQSVAQSIVDEHNRNENVREIGLANSIAREHDLTENVRAVRMPDALSMLRTTSGIADRVRDYQNAAAISAEHDMQEDVRYTIPAMRAQQIATEHDLAEDVRDPAMRRFRASTYAGDLARGIRSGTMSQNQRRELADKMMREITDGQPVSVANRDDFDDILAANPGYFSDAFSKDEIEEMLSLYKTATSGRVSNAANGIFTGIAANLSAIPTGIAQDASDWAKYRVQYGDGYWTDFFTKPMSEVRNGHVEAGLAGRPIDEDSLTRQLYGVSQEQKNAATAGLSENGIAGTKYFSPKWLAEQGISVVENAPNMLLTAMNPAVGTAYMVGNAGGGRALELSEQGVNAGEAVQRGLVSGVIEALTEKYSVENFLDAFTNNKGILINILSQMGVEASEESASYVLNYVADLAARDPNAEFTVAELIDNAMGGAFSGGIYGGIGQVGRAVGRAAGRSDQRQTQNQPVQQSAAPAASAQTAAQEAPSPVESVFDRALREQAERGSISNSTAEAILADSDAMDALGVRTDNSMTKSQQRTAVKEAVRSRQNAQDSAVSETGNDASPDTENAVQAEKPRTVDTSDTAREVAAAVQETPLTREVVEADLAALDAARGVLGENGAKSIRALYDGRQGTIGADELYRSYLPYYEAGVNGRDASTVDTRYRGVLNEVETKIAYEAGQMDAAKSLQAESISSRTAAEQPVSGNTRETVRKTKKNSVTVYGDDAGLVESEISKKLKAEDVEFIDTMLKAVGSKGILTSRESEYANADVENGFVTIYSNADDAADAYRSTVKHEVTHRIKELGANTYSDYESVAVRMTAKANGVSVSKLISDYQIRYREQAGQSLTRAEAREEIAADFAMHLNVDARAATEFVNQSVENRRTAKTILETIREVLRSIADRFTKDKLTREQMKFTRELEKAERLWAEALGEASVTAQKAEAAEGGKKTGGKRYSLSSIANTFFGNENMSAAEFEKLNYKETQGYKDYVEICVNNMRQTRPDFDEKAARAEIEAGIDGIIRVAIAAKKAGYDIHDDAAHRDTKDSKNRLLFSSLEPNSEYFTSHDISTICDKRKNFAEIYDDIVRAEEAKGVPQGKRFFDNVDNYFYLHKLMADKGLTQPCRQCYVESMRKNLAPMASAFLRLVNETNPYNLSNDQLYQQNGKNKGAIKTNNATLRERVLALLDEYDMTANDLTTEMLTTADGLAQLKITAPLLYEAFNSFYGQSKPKMPKGATPFRFGELTALLTDEHGRIKRSLVDKISSTGGFRLQSYSDFQLQNFTDVLQVIFEAGTLGLDGHAYTKVPAFLEATKGTNLKRNISIFMYKDGGEWKLDKNDSFPYDLDEIYDIVRADKSGNTGIIAVSQNEDMSAWIMANDMIGYGIPFHKSGLKMGTVRDTIVRDGGREIKGYSGTKDHTKQQTEVWAKAGDDHKAMTKVKKPINIYRFWDFDNKANLSKNELIRKNVEAYIDACNDMGYLPKFREYVMNNDRVLSNTLRYAKELGCVSPNATIDDISFEYGRYRIPYGYYKFLGDFGMFTPDGKASPHEVLSLKNYDFDQAVEFFRDSETLRRNEILQQFANGEERQRYRDSDMTAEELQEVVARKRREIAEDVVNKKTADRTNPDIRYSIKGQNQYMDRIDELRNKYGEIPQGEYPSREIIFPQQTNDDTRVRRFSRTAAESNALTDEQAGALEQAVLDGVFDYEVVGDKGSIAQAELRVSLDEQQALQDWKTAIGSGNRITKDDITLGEVLLRKAAADGDTDAVVQLTAEIAEAGTRAGQVVQAMRLLKKMSGAGQLASIDVLTKQYQRMLNKRYGNKAPQITIPDSMKQRLAVAKTDAEIAAAKDEIFRHIASQIPSNWEDKWNAWRYLSMLWNLRTHDRNFFGNLLFSPVVCTKNAVGAVLEAGADMVSKKARGKGIERTKTLQFASKEARDFAKADYAEMEDIVKNGGKYNDSQKIDDYRTIFTNKALEWARKANGGALEWEDGLFLNRHYRRALASYLTANHVDVSTLNDGSRKSARTLDRARAYAIREAQKATYRDASQTAEIINRASRQSNRAVRMVIEGVLPFKKTPLNILKRGVEYSPAGLVKALYKGVQGVKDGKYSANEVIDDLASGLTGTGVVAAGYLLTSLGLLSGGADDDDKSRWYKDMLGYQTYALTIGDKSYTLDWAAPGSMPLFVGAELFNLSHGDQLGVGDLLSAVEMLTAPLNNMSMLSGLNDTLDNLAYGGDTDNALANLFTDSVLSYLSQAVPTLGGQIARTIDGTRRTTYADKNNNIPDSLERSIQKAGNKIPYLSQKNPAYINLWGETEETENPLYRLASNMLSPGYADEVEMDDLDRELLRLYDATGEDVFPDSAGRSIRVDGETKRFTVDEFQTYATTLGQTSHQILYDLALSKQYKDADDADKVVAVDLAYKYANAVAKTKVSDYKLDGWIAKAYEGASVDLSPDDYILYKLACLRADVDENNSISQEEAKNAIDSMSGLSKKQKAYLWQSQNKMWSEKNNPYL